MIEFLDGETISLMSEKLYRKLTEGLHAGELVNVTGFRQIGKTTALVRFARERNLPIITFNQASVQCIKSGFDYQEVYSVTTLPRGAIQGAVIEEMVDKRRVEEAGIDVVTGYFSYIC